MAVLQYEAGTEVLIRAKILDQRATPPVLFDPDSVRILLARPDGSIAVDYALMTLTSTPGVYEYAYQTIISDMAGIWTVQIKTTEGSSVVIRSAVAAFELLSTVPAGAVVSQGVNPAPVGATYIVQTPDGTLTAEQALSLLATGIMKVTTLTGVVSSLAIPLTVPNGGTGAATLASAGVVLGNGTGPFLTSNVGAADMVLRIPGAGGTPAFGAIDLSKSAAVSGTLPSTNGGVNFNAVTSDVVHAQSSTTLSNVTGATVPVSASATQIIHFMAELLVTATSITPDFKFGFTVPAGCTMFWGTGASSSGGLDHSGPAVGTGMPALKTESQTESYGSGAVTGAIRLSGWIFGGGTSGNVQLQFAQDVSDASDITIKKGSFIRYHVIAS